MHKLPESNEKILKGPNSFWGLRAGYWKILNRAQLILEGLRAEGWVVGVCQRTMLHLRLGFLEVPLLKLKQPDPGGVP